MSKRTGPKRGTEFAIQAAINKGVQWELGRILLFEENERLNAIHETADRYVRIWHTSKHGWYAVHITPKFHGAVNNHVAVPATAKFLRGVDPLRVQLKQRWIATMQSAIRAAITKAHGDQLNA